MSYCRWSSDNFKCDLYCYESDSGFITHVADYRQRLWFVFLHWLTDKRIDLGNGIKIRQSRLSTRFWYIRIPSWLRSKRIRNKFAGQTFTDETEEEMFATMRVLQQQGFHVPTSAFESDYN